MSAGWSVGLPEATLEQEPWTHLELVSPSRAGREPRLGGRCTPTPRALLSQHRGPMDTGGARMQGPTNPTEHPNRPQALASPLLPGPEKLEGSIA